MTENYVIEQFKRTINTDLVAHSVKGDEFKLNSVIGAIGQNKIGMTIVDLGCGRGRFCYELKKLGFSDIIGIEPVSEFLPVQEEETHGMKFIVGSASSIPLSDLSVDVVILSEVVQHIPDMSSCLKEIRRVLKTNGQIIIFDRNVNALHTKFFIPMRLWKKYKELTGSWMYDKNTPFKEIWYSKKDLTHILVSDGFIDVRHRYISHNGRSKLLFKMLPKIFLSYSLWVAVK
jgi:ubiquinone/menaquinone biosynthesis C-methylase UbiE